MITAIIFLSCQEPSPVVPGTRGVVDDVHEMGPYGPTPQAITLVAGIDPETLLGAGGPFANEAEARACESSFPSWRRRLMLNPMLLWPGLPPCSNSRRAVARRETLFLRASTTAEELQVFWL